MHRPQHQLDAQEPQRQIAIAMVGETGKVEAAGMALPRGVWHDEAHACARPILQRSRQLVDARCVEGVEGFGAIEGQADDDARARQAHQVIHGELILIWQNYSCNLPGAVDLRQWIAAAIRLYANN